MTILTRIMCLAFALFTLFTLSKGVSVALGPPTSAFTESLTATPTPTCFAPQAGGDATGRDETVTATATPTPICSPTISQPTVFASNIDGAGSNLRWKRFVPPSGGPKWPAALIIPGGRWRNDALDLFNICEDLACAGYLAFSVEYRRACPHAQMTTDGPQFDPPSDGHPPEQTDDIQRAILAARGDSQCNGKVVLLGFSAGAGHAAWWAIAGTTDGGDKPDAVVACSGVYNLDNADILATGNAKDIENYIAHHVSEGHQFDVAAKAASSQWLPFTSTPCPILLFNSDSETIPKSELLDMSVHMTNYGGYVESHLRSGSQHAADYWNLGYGAVSPSPTPTVKDRSIDFLNWVLGLP